MLGFEAEQDDRVGSIEEHGEARFHGHGVDVLHAGGETRHLYVLAAHLPCHVGQVGDGGDDLQLFGCPERSRHRQQHGRQQRRRETSHGDPPHRFVKPWTWLPRMTVHCRKNWLSCCPGSSSRGYWKRSRWNSDAQKVRYGEYDTDGAPHASSMFCTYWKRKPG